MKPRKLLATAVFAFAAAGLAHAADLAGKWTAEFDSQIGLQKYTYEFKTDGGKLVGKAAFEHSMGNGEVDLKDIKVKGDDVSFTESFNADGNEITISYTGKINGDEMKLTRQVGDFATEELVAKRVKAPEAKPVPAK